jgi:putative flippase GtrA
MKHILKQFLQRDAHPVIQFIKYGIAGGMATAVDVVAFYFLAWKVIPALGENDLVARLLGITVTAIDEAMRSRNYLICKCITFLFSNLTAYLVNIYWVFKPGRHKLWVEVVLFYSVSIVSFSIGTGLGWVMIAMFGLSTTFAYGSNLIASVMINYVCRKYIIFKG